MIPSLSDFVAVLMKGFGYLCFSLFSVTELLWHRKYPLKELRSLQSELTSLKETLTSGLWPALGKEKNCSYLNNNVIFELIYKNAKRCLVGLGLVCVAVVF